MQLSFRAHGVLRWVTIGLVVIAFVGTFGASTYHQPPGPVWIGALLSAGAALPLVVDIGPALSLLATGALSFAYLAGGYSDGPLYFAIPVVVLAVAWSSSRRVWPWVIAAAALGAGGLWARGAFHAVQRPVPWQVIGQLAMIIAAYAIAIAIRAQRTAASARARSAASEERLRMAADLHDGVGHGLALIAMQAGAALHVLDRDPNAVRANLEAIRDVSRESLEQLRSQVAQLAGNARAPRTPARGIAEIPELVNRVREGGLIVTLTIDAEGPLPESVDRTAYAVVQESLTNVLRHAEAATATVSIFRSADALTITVHDDGHAVAIPGAPGQGMTGMRSRVEALGGTLEAGRTPSGFRVHATIPTEATA